MLARALLIALLGAALAGPASAAARGVDLVSPARGSRLLLFRERRPRAAFRGDCGVTAAPAHALRRQRRYLGKRSLPRHVTVRRRTTRRKPFSHAGTALRPCGARGLLRLAYAPFI